MELRFRQADTREASHLADILLCADADTFNFLLERLTPAMNPRDILTALSRMESTAYSLRRFTLAENDQRVLGGYNAIPSEDYPALDNALVDAMRLLPGFGVFPMLRWFFRRLQLARRSTPIPLPSNSLVLANIAVFPPHRGLGVGSALLRHLITTAQHGPFDSLCLFVWQDRQPVIELYEHMGFRITNTTPFRPHKRLPHHGRCLMQLPLTARHPGKIRNQVI